MSESQPRVGVGGGILAALPSQLGLGTFSPRLDEYGNSVRGMLVCEELSKTFTISRELVRNTGARGYRFKQAHEKASQRRQEASDKPRKMTPDLVELIEEKLTQEQWSPDQISGRLAKDGVAFISHERIYQHVFAKSAVLLGGCIGFSAGAVRQLERTDSRQEATTLGR